MKRKSYVTNFSTKGLFLVLEENKTEYLELEKKLNSSYNKLLNERLNQIKLTISIVKDEIINRYLDENINLRDSITFFLNSFGVKREVYQELFVYRCLTSNELVSLDLLVEAISYLDADQLMMLIEVREDSIIGRCAKNRYSEMLFEVDEEVKKELKLKIKLDRRECKYGKY